MNEKLKEAFECVQADEELKNRTKEFISRKTKGYTHRKSMDYVHFVSAAACVLFLLLGGHRLYFTSTAEISIDINPSIELGINRFDRVVRMKGYNDDGRELLDSLDIKYRNYSEAVEQIMKEEQIESLLADEGIMTIAVTGTDEEQSAEILSGVQSCTAEQNNTYCYYAQKEEVEKAHELGLSYGKYRAFLEVQSLDPDITADTVKEMSMREIKDLIAKLSGGSETTESGSGNEGGRGQENKSGSHNGQKNGKGRYSR